MKYFIAHLLSGDAKRYHEALTSELARHFHIEPLSRRVPPHLTFKVPFEAESSLLTDVERVIRETVRSRPAPTLFLKGFGHFGYRTIYLNVEKSPEAVALARELVLHLVSHVPWLPKAAHDGKKLHASVARFLERQTFHRLWRLLKNHQPHFMTNLDNVAILKQEDGVWKLHTLIPVGEEREHGFSPGKERAEVSLLS
ncbi:hypothetical protein A2841_03235 [Candidatus Kaiserbacteria bacterium RIFCSPHIGHO2_01_FULL_48_10]|uniref:2'-5' RNA ligase n=1 Tax=Candidatus Kaiserbacteria bacterium RIFCSPHIGHO2_01_FULL_48_10 TaxID=1798476 RepID=A0A1F6C1Q2_9BACT|nr:MAG: hypothetical protein A2841_03235 [Candidatus Kaiserbacteria bacterium RIFCSPHIGHO2_01_FULL_48_10]